MKFYHNCAFPKIKIEGELNAIHQKTRCSECGRKWLLVHRHTGATEMTQRRGLVPNLKWMLFNWRFTRELRASRPSS